MRRGLVVLAVAIGVVVIGAVSAAGAAQIVEPTTSPFVARARRRVASAPLCRCGNRFRPGSSGVRRTVRRREPEHSELGPGDRLRLGQFAGTGARIVRRPGGVPRRRPESSLPSVRRSQPPGSIQLPRPGQTRRNQQWRDRVRDVLRTRLASATSTATSDQVLFAITLPATATPPPTTTTGSGTPGSTTPKGSTSSTVGGATTTTKPGSRPTTTTQAGSASKKSTTTTAGSSSTAGAAIHPGGGSGSSGGTIAFLIGAIVVAAGVAGYVWAWRRRRSAAAGSPAPTASS